jgi:DNA-binding CsgD family transcriptional regulator
MNDTPHWELNPWGLSKAEVAVLAAVIEHGSFKGAARALCRAVPTIGAHGENARQKMGLHDANVRGSRVRYLILFDRWARGNLPK